MVAPYMFVNLLSWKTWNTSDFHFSPEVQLVRSPNLLNSVDSPTLASSGSCTGPWLTQQSLTKPVSCSNMSVSSHCMLLFFNHFNHVYSIWNAFCSLTIPLCHPHTHTHHPTIALQPKPTPTLTAGPWHVYVSIFHHLSGSTGADSVVGLGASRANKQPYWAFSLGLRWSPPVTVFPLTRRLFIIVLLAWS